MRASLPKKGQKDNFFWIGPPLPSMAGVGVEGGGGGAAATEATSTLGEEAGAASTTSTLPVRVPPKKRALQAKPARWELSEQEQVNNVVREYGSTLYIGLSRFPHRANTNRFHCNSLAREHFRPKF